MNIITSLVTISLGAALSGLANTASAAVGTSQGTACESQVVPTMPRSAMRNLRRDEVKVRALVKNGVVREVELLKGSSAYAGAIRAAMAQYRCQLQDADFWVTQDFDFDAR